MPAEYRSLHKYLDSRYADTVVLRFAEIEDLLGFALPHRARLRQDRQRLSRRGSPVRGA